MNKTKNKRNDAKGSPEYKKDSVKEEEVNPVSQSDGASAASSTNTEFNNISNNNSRLIVKNLPGSGKKNKWDEQRVRAFFGKYGKITDVKLKINEKTGTCKFAFVGFEQAEFCRTAIEKLNGTFLHGTKLQLEECAPLSDERKEITKKFTMLKMAKRKGSNQPNADAEVDVDELLTKQILDTGRLFLRNLPFSCTEENLTKLFQPFGPLAEMECIVDRSGQCKGYALCTFMFPEHALAAWKELDGKIFMGRILHIIAGEEKVKKTDQGVQQQGKPLSAFQRERQANQRENAEKTSHTWNALFLGSNAVAETLADSYDVEKRHLLLDEGQNSAAVRMAMAETRLVRETRKFLLDHGVKLDAFSQPAPDTKRSKTVILVKNLTGKQGESGRLREMFGRYGAVKSLIMPPAHGISALVEMCSELDAKKAFGELAYAKKFTNGQPLYLEWAPMDVFDESHTARQPPKSTFDEIIKKEDENDDEQEGGGKGEEKGEKEPERTKIIVRNVPFQANLKEITQLFSAFGELKFVRMPNKPGGEGHRGFCFVDFVSVGDARRAMDSLAHSTHLYKRRLVLEWAKQEETMDELRSKTKRKAHWQQSTGGGRKKTKIRSFAAED